MYEKWGKSLGGSRSLNWPKYLHMRISESATYLSVPIIPRPNYPARTYTDAVGITKGDRQGSAAY